MDNNTKFAITTSKLIANNSTVRISSKVVWLYAIITTTVSIALGAIFTWFGFMFYISNEPLWVFLCLAAFILASGVVLISQVTLTLKKLFETYESAVTEERIDLYYKALAENMNK